MPPDSGSSGERPVSASEPEPCIVRLLGLRNVPVVLTNVLPLLSSQLKPFVAVVVVQSGWYSLVVSGRTVPEATMKLVPEPVADWSTIAHGMMPLLGLPSVPDTLPIAVGGGVDRRCQQCRHPHPRQ